MFLPLSPPLPLPLPLPSPPCDREVQDIKVNLQEKLESANKLFEDLKKGKEELDARKEIYERCSVCARAQLASHMPISAMHTVWPYVVRDAGSTTP